MLKRTLALISALFIAHSAFAQSCIWTDNPKGPSCSIIPQKSGLTLGSSTHAFGNVYGTFVGPIGGGATNDIVTIFGDVSVVPSAGALNATEANIVAVRLY